MNSISRKLINIFAFSTLLFYFTYLHNDVRASYKSAPLFDSSNLIWANRMGGTYNELGNVITMDANGQIYLSGVFMGTSDFDPGAGIVNLTSAGDNSSPFNAKNDVFISKLEANGDLIWAKRIGGANHDASNGIVTDENGNVYITGSFTEIQKLGLVK